MRRAAFFAVPLVLLAVAAMVWPSSEPEAVATRAPAPHRRRMPRPRPPSSEPAADDLFAAPALLEGRVEDPSRRRVAGARVLLRGDEVEVVTTSASDGSFRFDLPDDGSWLVLADHARFSVGGVAGPIAVREGRAPDHLVVVVLGSAAALSVRVVDPAGAGVAGASVTLDGSGAIDTDSRGEAMWPALRPEGRAVVRAVAAGFAPASERVRLTAGQTAEVLLQLDPGRELRGRVLDPDRRLAPGAVVRVAGDRATTTTDANGEFVMVDLPDQRVVLVAEHPDFAPSAPVTAEAGARWVELTLSAPSSVSGFVRARDGSGASGAAVMIVAEDRETVTTTANDRGVFALSDLPPGDVQVVGRLGADAGRTAATLEPGRETTRVEVILQGSFSARGRVVERFGGDPIPGARIRSRLVRGSGGSAPGAGTTDEDGRFVIEGLPLDVASLDVRAVGYRRESVPLEPTGADLDVGDVGVEPRVFGGVGMTLAVREGEVQILGLFRDAPASRAGLASGDVVLEIDSERVDGLDLAEVVARIRGTEGSDVRMLIRRAGEPEPLEVVVTRETIDPDRMEREESD